MTLVASGLTHGYVEGVDVFAAVDLRLDPGEAVALIGPNGAGKTTLLRVCAGLVEPRSGHLSIAGDLLHTIPRRELARRVSVVAQAQPDAFGFTALEFVLMGFHAHAGRFSLDSASQRTAALDALHAMAVAAFAERPMSQLSGGEAQRVVVARTLASKAPIWLLDEPTANLDLRHQLALLDTVRAHCDAGGCALAIVHDPNLVERWFDRVLVLAGGGIVASGPPREVFSPEMFETAFGVRMAYRGAEGEGAWVPDLDLDDDGDVEPLAGQRSSV